MNGTTLEFPNLPAPSRGMKRALALITESSQIIYGQKARLKHYYQIIVPSNKTFLYFRGKLY